MGAKLYLEIKITHEFVDKEQPNIVIIAKGFAPSRSPFPGADQKNVISVWYALQDRVSIRENIEEVDSAEVC